MSSFPLIVQPRVLAGQLALTPAALDTPTGHTSIDADLRTGESGRGIDLALARSDG